MYVKYKIYCLKCGIEDLRNQERASTPFLYIDPSSVSSGCETYSHISKESENTLTTIQNQNCLLNRSIFQTFRSTFKHSQ